VGDLTVYTFKNASLLIISIILLSSACCAATKGPEMRVLWVERWGITSPEACATIVKAAKQYNFNCLLVQVRGSGDAFYNSHFEPRAHDLAKQPADFDPLATIIKEAHQAGLQVHAWLNANYIWGSKTMPTSAEHIVYTHPEWLMRNKANEVVIQSTPYYDGGFCCPGHVAFTNHLRDVFVDVVTNYDVDGISFDFIRYPDTNFCYCDWCLSRFKAEMNAKIKPEEKTALAAGTDRLAYVNAYPQAWDDFRRQLITDEVYKIHDAVKSAKPNVVLSASVFAKASGAYTDRLQDWKRWLADGKLDLLLPMAYVKSTDTFAGYVKEAVASSNGVPICPNIGSYLIPADSTIEKILKARELGAAGAGVYCWAITKDGKDTSYLQTVCDKAYLKPVSLRLSH
jgi:uncharacterized lipoprotein YddW (UPF0748 family)